MLDLCINLAGDFYPFSWDDLANHPQGLFQLLCTDLQFLQPGRGNGKQQPPAGLWIKEKQLRRLVEGRVKVHIGAEVEAIIIRPARKNELVCICAGTREEGDLMIVKVYLHI